MQSPSISSPRASSTHSIKPVSLYVGVGVILLLLSGLTLLLAQFDLGVFNTIAALGIATVQAILVSLFFMNLYYDNKFFTAIMLIGVITLAVFLTFTMIDSKSRSTIYDVQMQEIRKRAKMYEPKKATPPAAPSVTPSPETK